MTRLAKLLKDGLFLCAFLVLSCLIIAKIDLGGGSSIAGPFFAIDGDTLATDGERLRLIGIDAPEKDQTCGGDGHDVWTCGSVAREALSKLASSPDIRCAGSARDRYGRLLVDCRLGDLDINADLVRRGMAVAYGRYGGEETAARGEGKGLWSGPFETPAAWRKARGIGRAGDDAPRAAISLEAIAEWIGRLWPWS
ncbi:thermonuclease family protein [Neorhizobium sp. NCHU2750]|uniref:thermonuclease family protein n=1 Tax=Neorhizobium sp. NCHU2750 TaxID=1825976 RepID=UPI000EB69AE3|nr:succinoglycan biosynthesis protein [Neorhizobium sp. NCHU2750]